MLPDPADDLPAEVAANLSRIQRSLPATWRVSQPRRDATAGWIVDLTDEQNQHMGEVLLWPGQAQQAEEIAGR